MATSSEQENVEIIVGTYEEFLLGYEICLKEEKYELTQSFANHAHGGSVRCLSCKGKFVASGSTDETIRLFNMTKRAEVGCLQQHNGTINSLEFCGDSHLASCSDDGTVCIWNTHSWQCLKTLRGHKSNVNSVCVHPSGKLAFSVSKDRTLRTWNLVKGRSAYVTNVKDVAECVVCAPDGEHFVVVIRNKVDIYGMDAAGVVHSIDFGKKALCVHFLNKNVIAVGGEKEEVEFHHITKKKLLKAFKAHSKRVKVLSSMAAPEGVKGATWLLTASNDGFIKVWQADRKLKEIPELVTEVDTKCRITCMAVSRFQRNQEEEEPKETTDKKRKAVLTDERVEEKEDKKRVHFRKKNKTS